MSQMGEGASAGEARREHRNAWAFAVAAGLGLIAVSNLFGWSPWVVAPLLCVLMVVFGVSITRLEVSADSKGDSLYYLGLLFTFLALVAALVAFDWGSDATTAMEIIRNFGIALVTTIFGLAGRVWFAMAADAPGDLEEALRGDLERAVSDMKASLNRTRDGLDILVGGFDESGAAMTETVARIAEIAENAAQTVAALDALKQSLVGMQDLGAQLAEASTQVWSFIKALETAQRAAAPISASLGESAEGLRSVAARTAGLNGTLGDLADKAEGASRAVGKVEDLARGASHDVQTRLTEAERQAARAGRGVHGLTKRTDALCETVDSIHEPVRRARVEMANLAGTTEALNREFANIDGHGVAKSVDSAWAEGERVGAELEGLGHQTQELSESMAVTQQETDKLNQALRKARWSFRSGVGLWAWFRGLFRRRDRAPKPGAQ